MKTKVLATIIILSLFTFLNHAYCEVKVFPPVVRASKGEQVSYVEIYDIILEDEEVMEKVEKITIKYPDYVLYPEQLVKNYLKLFPKPSIIRILRDVEYLDHDIIAQWYKALYDIYFPGIACVYAIGKNNLFTGEKSQDMVGVITDNREIIWLWNNPYFFETLEEFKL